jgi:hypothetical protein
VPDVARYRVIFRACEVTLAYNGKPRPFGLDKRTLVQLCFLSLVRALEGVEHSIHVVGDRLSDELVDFFRSFGVSLSNQELDNSRSLAEALRLALAVDDADWVYFCEDDYLHEPAAFACVDDLIEHRAEYLAYKPKPRWRRLRVDELECKPLCIFLPDYPHWYRARTRQPAFLFHSRFRHWRQVTTTTGSFIARADYLKRKRAALERFAATTDDRALSKSLYGSWSFRDRALCVAPLPGLASHMHEGTMSVFGDCERLLEVYRRELASRKPAGARA